MANKSRNTKMWKTEDGFKVAGMVNNFRKAEQVLVAQLAWAWIREMQGYWQSSEVAVVDIEKHPETSDKWHIKFSSGFEHLLAPSESKSASKKPFDIK